MVKGVISASAAGVGTSNINIQVMGVEPNFIFQIHNRSFMFEI
jgi:hypothetical protein